MKCGVDITIEILSLKQVYQHIFETDCFLNDEICNPSQPKYTPAFQLSANKSNRLRTTKKCVIRLPWPQYLDMEI